MSDTESLALSRLSDAVRIGRGGQANVFRARDSQLNRDVAVKVFFGDANAADVERQLGRELRALGSLTGHPNIVTVYRTGLTDLGQPYVEMEYLAGGSLWSRISSHGSVPEPDVVRIGEQIAAALAAAHDKG